LIRNNGQVHPYARQGTRMNDFVVRLSDAV
jgi:hypothetical protein